MATMTPPKSLAPASEINQRVRHPLEAVRAHIRKYVLLETLAAVLLFLMLFFWASLAIDYGTFWTFAYDWVLELDFLDGGGQASWAVRLAMLVIVGGVLAYLIFTHLFMRMGREFSDKAVALVLERRFPKELGDRLITAVELADHKKAEELGFSRAMLVKTCNEAAERVEKLPVSEVFDWARLRRGWRNVILATIGLFVVSLGVGLGAQAIKGETADPFAYLWNFKDNSAIWAERNLLLRDSYWLRSAYIELVGFSDAGHPGEMRVPRNEQRPDLVARVVAWVTPDREAVGGWRPLKVKETAVHLPDGLYNKINIPSDWPGWVIDLDDLDTSVPKGAVPASWQGKPAGEVLQAVTVDGAIPEGVKEKIRNLGNWQTWTYDKLLSQIQKPEIRQQLLKEYPDVIDTLGEIEDKLKELAAMPSMNRRLRYLKTPDEVGVYFRGATTKASAPGEPQAGGKFNFGLGDLKESSSFYVRGGDFFTKPMKITLQPPPMIREISIDKDEPAYLYYWLSPPQTPLKGLRQVFKNVSVSVTGDASVIDVPVGTSLVLHAKVDRPVKDGIRISQATQVQEPGTAVPESIVSRDGDGKGFTVEFPRVDRAYDFQFEFHDEDNVRGKRRIRIRPVDDQAPEVVGFEFDAVFRKMKQKEGVTRALAGAAADGLLCTPDAVLPFAGTIRDDIALTDARWVFEAQPIIIESGAGKDPGRIILQGSPDLRRAVLIGSAFQFSPLARIQNLAAPSYLNLVAKVIEFDLKQKPLETQESVPLAQFEQALSAKIPMPLAEVTKRLTEKPGEKPFLKMHSLKAGDQEFFNVRQNVTNLKMRDATSQAQLYYTLKVWVSATDNNVETGPGKTKTRAPVTFLIVSEADLLTQIGLEEEALRDRLEKIIQKLKVAKTTMNAQVAALRVPQPDGEAVALRVEEIGRALQETGSSTRETHADYSRILAELNINRCRKDKISTVDAKIVQPLGRIVMPELGSFSIAENTRLRLASALEEDVANKKVSQNAQKLIDAAVQTDNQIGDLIEDLNAVLLAIDSGLDFNGLLLIAENLLNGQRNVVEPIRVYQGIVLDDIFNQLEAPKK